MKGDLGGSSKFDFHALLRCSRSPTGVENNQACTLARAHARTHHGNKRGTFSDTRTPSKPRGVAGAAEHVRKEGLLTGRVVPGGWTTAADSDARQPIVTLLRQARLTRTHLKCGGG